MYTCKILPVLMMTADHHFPEISKTRKKHAN